MKEEVILIIGACGLDRLLVVPSNPAPDDKIRTTGYHEVGGGNAANTATAMALMCDAAFLNNRSIRVKLCGKVGADAVGRKIIEKLSDAKVDLSSPLFLVGGEGTTTGQTTVIVSSSEFTRTCLHTPGTCGELSLEDLAAVDIDEVFSNVVHLHTDARHSDVALELAREAKRRNITVSLDVEKDRGTRALDELMELADILFTNSQQIEMYLNKLTNEKEDATGQRRLKDSHAIAHDGDLKDAEAELYTHLIRPCSFFNRWFGQVGKEVVVTRGEEGVAYISCTSATCVDLKGNILTDNQVTITIKDKDMPLIMIQETVAELTGGTNPSKRQSEFQLITAGVLADLDIVDTTGAGDAFIAGFIMYRLGMMNSRNAGAVQRCLQFGSWVGGRKLEGPGAQSALPRAKDIDLSLGISIADINETLSRIISKFGKLEQAQMSRAGDSWESFERTDVVSLLSKS